MCVPVCVRVVQLWVEYDHFYFLSQLAKESVLFLAIFPAQSQWVPDQSGALLHCTLSMGMICVITAPHTSLSSLPSAQSVYLWSVFLMSCEIFITIHLTNGCVSLTTNPTLHGLQLLQYWLNQDLSASLAEFSSPAHSTLNVHSLNDIHNWMYWAANSVLTIWPS